MTHKTQLTTKADVGRTYWFAVSALVVAILFVAIKISAQAQMRHKVYHELSLAKRAHHELKIEKNRLLIEQQTYSATPSVAVRAVSELGMYFPGDKDRLVIAPPTPHPPISNP